MAHISVCVHTRVYVCVCVFVLSHSVVSNSVTPMDCRGYPKPERLLCSLGISRQENWHGFPYPLPGDLPHPGIKPRSPTLWTDSLSSEPQGKSSYIYSYIYERGSWRVNIKKTNLKILPSSPNTEWQVEGEEVKVVMVEPLLGLQNHCGGWLQPWNQKTIASWQESNDKPKQCVEKQSCYSVTKVHIVKAMVFPVVM